MSSDRRVLLVSHSHDLHVDLIMPLLQARGLRPFRLNLDCFPRDYVLVQQYLGQQWQISLTNEAQAEFLDLAEVGAVWLRKPAPYEFGTELGPQELQFANDECEHALLGLIYGLQQVFWLSHPLALRSAGWKGEQLQRALRMGFQIPHTVLGNAPHAVQALAQHSAGRVIFKVMSSPALAADRVTPAERQNEQSLHTTLLDAEQLQQLDAVRLLPGQFQTCIEKAHELRVTVIGRRCFSARIDSQSDERTKIDSRDMSAPTPYAAAILPPEIEQRCIDFVASYGLQYGAIDLIVTPQGEYVFLENNPTGQFWYVQQLVPELKMLEAVADLLAEGTT